MLPGKSVDETFRSRLRQTFSLANLPREKRQLGKIEDYVRTINKRGESALHYGGKIKKSQLHFPDEDRQIIKHLMDNGADVFLQTKEVEIMH